MKLLLRRKKWGLGLSCCTYASGGTDKIQAPQGSQDTWIHTAEGWIHSHVIQQFNINQKRTVQHQSEEKCTQKRLLCFFHPSVPKSLAFPCPAPVLETAINCPCIPSLDNYSHLQGSASLQGCISQGEWKRQRRGITSCGHRSAQCGRYPWDSQQTRQEVHPLLSQRHPQCAHQCHETSPEHSHHPQGYKCLKEERELKHTTLSETLPFLTAPPGEQDWIFSNIMWVWSWESLIWKVTLFPLTHGCWWAKKGKCPSVPIDISTLIKTSIVTPGLFTLLALSITFTMMILTMFWIEREKRQALNISFQLTAPI